MANNVVLVEDILNMYNIDDELTEMERYNERIWCHYIEWALKICLENLIKVKNDFTLMIFLLRDDRRWKKLVYLAKVMVRQC